MATYEWHHKYTVRISKHTDSQNSNKCTGQSDAASSLSSALSDGLKTGSKTSIRSSIITWSIRAAPTPAAACAAPSPLHSTRVQTWIIQPGTAGQLSRGRLDGLAQICSCSFSSASHAGPVCACARQTSDTPSAAGSAGTYRERRSSGSRHSEATAAAASLLSWTHHTAGPWGGWGRCVAGSRYSPSYLHTHPKVT